MNELNVFEAKTAALEKAVYTPPIQSANTLFHFIGKLEYLISILEREAIVPRYCTETVDYLEIPHKSIAYPMLCFCDINLHKIENHISFYGRYGIAFSKEWGIKMGIQPIQYVNKNSYLCKDFSEAFNMALKSSYTDEVQNYLLSQMHFLKPIEGYMKRDGEDKYKNFTDECEWRYIPEVAILDLPQVLIDSEFLQMDILNKALVQGNASWLKFAIEDIKYLIIKDRDDFDTVLETILKKSKLNPVDQHKLSSKIILWDEAREDF